MKLEITEEMIAATKRWRVEEVAFGGLCVERDGQEVSAEELVALLNAAGAPAARKGRKRT